MHALIQVGNVCSEVEKTKAYSTPLEPSYEVDNTSNYDGQDETTYDKVPQSLSKGDYDDLGELALNHGKNL